MAEKDPTFRKDGRIPLLPFRDPFVTVARASRLPFVHKGVSLVDSTARRYEKLRDAGAPAATIALATQVVGGLQSYLLDKKRTATSLYHSIHRGIIRYIARYFERFILFSLT